MKLGLRITAGIVGVALLLVVGALVYLSSAPGEAFIRRKAVEAADKALEGTVSVQGLELNGTRLVLTGIVLKDPDGNNVAELERFEAAIRLTPLLSGAVSLSQITLVRPRLYLKEDARGLNLTRALEPKAAKEEEPSPVDEPKTQGGLQLTVDDFSMVDGFVSYEQDAEEAKPLRLDGLNSQGRFELHRSGALSAKLELGGSADGLVSGPLSFKVDATGDGADTTGSLSAALGETVLAVEGAMNRSGDGKVAVKRIVLAPELARALSPTYPLVVPVELSGSVDKTKDNVSLEVLLAAAKTKLRIAGQANVASFTTPGLHVSVSNVDLRALTGKGHTTDLGLTLHVEGGGKDLRSIDGQLKLDMPVASVGRQRVGPVKLRASAREGRITVAELTAQLPGLEVRGSGGGSPDDVAATVDVQARDLKQLTATLGDMGMGGVDAGGNGNLHVEVRGPPKRASVSVTGEFPRLRYGTYGMTALSLRASVPDVSRPLNANATVGIEQLTVGTNVLRQTRLAVQTQGQQLTVSFATQGFAPVALEAAGALGSDGRTLTLNKMELRYPEAHWVLQKPSLIDLGDPPHRPMRVQGLALAAGEQSLSLDLVQGATTVDAKLELGRLNLAHLPAAVVDKKLGVGGLLSASVSAKGPKSAPNADVRVSFDNGRALDLAGIELDFEVTVRGRRAEGELSLKMPEGEASARFAVPVDGLKARAQRLEVNAEVPRFDLGRVMKGARSTVPFEGVAKARVQLTGTVGDPKLDAALELANVRYVMGNPEPLAVEHVALRAVTDEKGKLSSRLDVQLSSQGEKSWVEVKTPLRLGPLLRAAPPKRVLLATPIEVDGDIRAALEELRGATPDPMTGKLTVRIAVDGPASGPAGTVGVALANVGKVGTPPLNGELTLALAAQEVSLKGRVHRNNAPLLVVDATLKGAPAELADAKRLARTAFDVRGTVGPVSLSALRAFGRPVDVEAPKTPTVDGELTMELAARGTPGDPTVELNARLQSMRLGTVALGNAQMKYMYRETRNALELAMLNQDGALELRAKTTLDLSYPAVQKLNTAGAPIDAQLTARRFDLAFLSGMTPLLRTVGGVLEADATFGGKVAAPSFRGDIRWRKGRLAMMGLGDYQQIELDLGATEREFSLRKMSMQSAGGRLDLSGRATKATRAWDLEATGTMKRFPLFAEDQIVALMSLRTDIRGQVTPKMVNLHSLKIPEAHLDLPQVKRKNLQELDRPEDIVVVKNGKVVGPKKKEEAPSGDGREKEDAEPTKKRRDEDGLTYVAVIDAPRNLWLNGPDMNAELGLSEDFRVEYTDKTLIYGEVKFRRGRVGVLGRRFDVDESSNLRFNGTAKEPHLNITATHNNERENVKVFVSIRGQGKDFTLRTSSEPPLTESEIYTLLATGRRTLKHGSGSSTGGAGAASVLGGLLASEFRKSIASKLPLDVLSIDAGESSSGRSTARVEAGTYLSDKTYVGGSYNFGADRRRENSWEVDFEYQFTPSVGLELGIGDHSSGADITWSRDY